MFAYLLGLVAGLAQPTQTSINTKLGDKVKSPYITSVISFVTALCLLTVILAIIEGGIYIPLSDVAKEPWWIWIGGLCGTGIVILSVVCLPQIGSAMTVVLTSFGQIITSLIIDQFGLFKSPQISMTFTRILGSILVIAGVWIISRPAESEKADGQKFSILYVCLAFCVGILSGTQIAVNGSLGKVVGSGWIGTFLSMSVGLIGTLALTGIVFLARGHNGIFGEGKDIQFKWYMLAGGSLGVVVVGANTIAAPLIGAGMVSVTNLIGFMVGGLVIDATGFLGINKKPITFAKVGGVLAMIGGTVIITLL